MADTNLDPIRAEALTQAVAFVGTWEGRKGMESVIAHARAFEHYLRTGAKIDIEWVTADANDGRPVTDFGV